MFILAPLPFNVNSSMRYSISLLYKTANGQRLNQPLNLKMLECRGTRARSKGRGSGPRGVGLRGFKSHPLHHRRTYCVSLYLSRPRMLYFASEQFFAANFTYKSKASFYWYFNLLFFLDFLSLNVSLLCIFYSFSKVSFFYLRMFFSNFDFSVKLYRY